MSNPGVPAGLFFAPMLLGSCAGVSPYAPSLDVYGSYFPAWLICLTVGDDLGLGKRLNFGERHMKQRRNRVRF